jgi:tripartite-type tricarboxylate transporter receptor subunit TctC
MSYPDCLRAVSQTFLLVAIFQFGCSAASTPATAQDISYTGRTVKVVVGFPPGGGYDIYARTLVRVLPRHLPGMPSVIVVNMPGAGSLTLANYLFNVAARDGTEIGSVETFIPFEAYFGGNEVRFDPRWFSWIAGLNSEMTTCVVWHASKIRSLGDLLAVETTFGATGSGAPLVAEPRVINAVLGTKIKVVTGYPGTPDVFLAMERGEVEGSCGVGWTTLLSTRGDWVAQGKVRILVQNATKRHPALPDVPLLLDFAKNDRQRKLLTLLAAPHRIGRPYLAPPGISADRLQVLRAAFEATLKDTGFLAAAEHAKLAINPVTGKEMESIIAEVAGMEPAVIQAMISARSDKGGAN